MPPSNVAGNDRNWPSTAAANAANVITKVKPLGDRPVSGATKIPANPATPLPTPQVIAPSRCGDQPSVCTARWFSAAARMARPRRVDRVPSQSTPVTPSVMAMM